jgi:FkbM family methyltransferase
MKFYSIKRYLRNIGVKILPAFIKKAVSQKLFKISEADKEKFSLFFSEEKDGLTAIINKSIRIKIEENTRHEYISKFRGDSVDEMLGFFSVSESTNTLFDIGADKGIFSLVFCNLGKDKRAVAYEPSPVTVEVTKQLIEINNLTDRIILENRAIGCQKGQLHFILERTGYVIPATFKNTTPVGTVKVKVTTIDDECDRLKIYPDIIKIDVEGYEFEAIQGAKRVLGTKKPIILLELHLNYLEERERLTPA